MSFISNSEHETLESTIHREKIDDKTIQDQLLKIQELDASIHSLGIKLEDLFNELNNSQIKNRNELRQMVSNSPECQLLARNTQLFLNLHSTEYFDEKIEKYDSQDLFDSADDVDDPEQLPMTDEEKQELKKLLTDESSTTELAKNYSDFGTEIGVNPYSVYIK